MTDPTLRSPMLAETIEIQFDAEWLVVTFTYFAGNLDIEGVRFAGYVDGHDIASFMDLCAAYGPRLWDQVEQRVMDAIKEDAIRAQYDRQICDLKEITP